MNLYIHVQHTVSIVFYSEETLSERQFFQGVEILGEVHHRLYWFVSMVILKTLMVSPYTILPHLVDQNHLNAFSRQ